MRSKGMGAKTFFQPLLIGVAIAYLALILLIPAVNVFGRPCAMV